MKISAPLDDKTIDSLTVGNRVEIDGIIYAARDAAHLAFRNDPPFAPKGQIIYYASPTPTPPGSVIGSIGPTTASRMDSFLEPMLQLGLKATIGKGTRSPAAIEMLKKYHAVYLLVPGGTAALLSQHVKQSEVIAFPELGPEAVLKLTVADLPAIVAIDAHGGNLFEEGKNKYRIK